MSLKAWRAALADAVSDGLGVTVYPWNAPAVDPPCVVVDPGEPYLALVDEEDTSFTTGVLRFTLWLIVRHAGEEASLDELDDLIDPLSDAVRATAPPEAGSSAALERVDTPSLLQIGGVDYLVARCSVNVLRPT